MENNKTIKIARDIMAGIGITSLLCLVGFVLTIAMIPADSVQY